jgi:hypothetical protein
MTINKTPLTANPTIQTVPQRRLATVANHLTAQASQPWHVMIEKSIPSYSYNYGPKLSLFAFSKIRTNLEAKINDIFRKAQPIHGDEFPSTIFEDDSIQMSGVAIVGTFLRRKYGLNNLFVCSSFQALQEKLKEINGMEGDIRMAMIVPDGNNYNSNIYKNSEFYWSQPCHKVAVCIEKFGSTVKIVVLDSLGTRPDLFGSIVKDFEKPGTASSIKIASEELKEAEPVHYIDAIVHHVLNSTQDKIQTQIFFVSADRQTTGHCCETFSLRSAVAFLRDPHFFEQIESSPVMVQAENRLLQLHDIKLLPPAHMKGTQYPAVLENFVKEYPSTPDKLAELEKMQQSISKHMIRVVPTSMQEMALIDTTDIVFFKDEAFIKGIPQNHYINHRSLKYHYIILKALELTSNEELRKIIAESLLLAKRRDREIKL